MDQPAPVEPFRMPPNPTVDGPEDAPDIHPAPHGDHRRRDPAGVHQQPFLPVLTRAVRVFVLDQDQVIETHDDPCLSDQPSPLPCRILCRRRAVGTPRRITTHRACCSPVERRRHVGFMVSRVTRVRAAGAGGPPTGGRL